MQVRHSIRMATAYALIVVAGLWPLPAPAADSLSAVPFVFIGKAGDCGPPAAGSHIVTAAWLGGMGLPDGDGDAALNGVPATADDPHRGLLLSKNGPSTDCSSAGARITGVKGMTVDAAFTLGFDYRNGGWGRRATLQRGGQAGHGAEYLTLRRRVRQRRLDAGASGSGRVESCPVRGGAAVPADSAGQHDRQHHDSL